MALWWKNGWIFCAFNYAIFQFFPRGGYDQMRFFRWLWSLESEAQKRCSAFSHNMELETDPEWKEATIGGTPFSISMIMGGRVGITWNGNTWINHCFFVLFKCFAGLVLWLTIGTSFWRAATRPTKKALAGLSSELSFCGCKKNKTLADPMTVAQRWQENQAAVFFAWKIGWWISHQKTRNHWLFGTLVLMLWRKGLWNHLKILVVLLGTYIMMNFPLEKRRWWFSPNKSVLQGHVMDKLPEFKEKAAKNTDPNHQCERTKWRPAKSRLLKGPALPTTLGSLGASASKVGFFQFPSTWNPFKISCIQ